MSRLGDHLRVAGTIELGGYDTSLTTPPLARALAPCSPAGSRRCCQRCATRGSADGAVLDGHRSAPCHPNIPYIGRPRGARSTPGTARQTGRGEPAERWPS
jgi:D-amino-acid dehydrogenase